MPIAKISNPHARRFAEFEVSKAMTECDVFINLPKLKTHSLTYFSGAVKNYFGLIPGLKKAEWHVIASNPDSFSDVISDLYGAILHTYRNKKILNICDAVVALEGDGPTTGGKARNLGGVIASFVAVALDAVAIAITGLDVNKSVITLATDRDGLGTKDLFKIRVIGEHIDAFNEEFKEPEKMHPGLKLLRYQWLKNILLETPTVDPDKCIGCGECTRICPPQTLKIRNDRYPSLNRRKCLRCWCCTEVCPKGAITKGKRPPLGRMIIPGGQK
jgi:ferredoxin